MIYNLAQMETQINLEEAVWFTLNILYIHLKTAKKPLQICFVKFPLWSISYTNWFAKTVSGPIGLAGDVCRGGGMFSQYGLSVRQI